MAQTDLFSGFAVVSLMLGLCGCPGPTDTQDEDGTSESEASDTSASMTGATSSGA